VLLFDEIEKAHPEVFNILLQVLDNGHLTDAKGRTVNFKNAVIILTSNIGAEHIDNMARMGFSTKSDDDIAQYEMAKEKVMSKLKDYFRPEFLNRLDETIIFNILSPEAIKEIVKIQVEQVRERLLAKEIKLEVSPAVMEFLAKEGYNPQYGARPLKRLIQNKILTPVASMMISEGVMEGGSVSVDVKNGEFLFEAKKSHTRKRRSTARASKRKEKVVA
jgi:ATP-dependent Clp protease ATP-binding subunit ClpC